MERIRCHRVNMGYEESIENRPGKYRCKACQYTSNRQYNVLRHEGRIHSQKLKRSCCGKIFYTKGEWYFHCEESHPKLRAASFISKKKYKIIKHSKKSVKSSIRTGEKIETRRSARIKESIEKEQSMMLIKFDAEVISGLQMEDVPLINFIHHRELRQKFIEQSCDTHNYNNSTTTLREQKSSDYSDQYSNHSSSLRISEDDSCANEQVFYDAEVKSQAVEYMRGGNDSHDHSNNSIENIASNSQSTIDFTFSSSIDSASKSELIATPIYLPLKKRILQEMRNDLIGHNHQRRLKEMSLNENENFEWNNKENIDPVFKNYFGVVNVSKKVTVTAAEESVTWNEITKHHRAYLSSVDWDHYKLC